MEPIVLLVEDDELVRDTVLNMLELHGIGTVCAENAERGLLEFETHPSIAIGILDMVLPGGKSGLDLAAELDRRRPGFPILYTSGLTDSIAMESIARRSPEVVLLKPFDEDTLIQRVTALMGSSSRPGPARSLTAMPPEGAQFPWDRLVEASDRIAGSGAPLMSYRDTAAGFAVAITHIAVLRAAGLAYAFRYTGTPAFPLALTVSPENRAEATRLIEWIGLGADIAAA